MAGLYIYYNPFFGGKNKLTEAFIKENSTFSHFSIVFWVKTLTLTQAYALSLSKRYINKNLQKTTKLALELFIKGQKYGQLQVNSIYQKQPLKAWFFNLFYKNLQLDCYCFCQ